MAEKGERWGDSASNAFLISWLLERKVLAGDAAVVSAAATTAVQVVEVSAAAAFLLGTMIEAVGKAAAAEEIAAEAAVEVAAVAAAFLLGTLIEGEGMCESDILLNESDIILNLVRVIAVPEKVRRSREGYMCEHPKGHL